MKKIVLSLLLFSTLFVLTGCGNKEQTQPKSMSGPMTMNFKEEKSTDANGNEVITRQFQDGRTETEVREGNKITRTNVHPNGFKDTSVEETLEDGTRIMTHTDPEGRIHKMTEKDLGEGKRHMIIENQLPDGTTEVIEEDHEEISEGVHKMTQKFQDGKIQTMLMTHNGKEDKSETTVTYPDGKIETTIEQFFHQDDGSTKIIKTNPDGTTEERVNRPYRP